MPAVSPQEIAVYRVIHAAATRPDPWLTSSEIAELAGVAPRTARKFAQRLSELWLVHCSMTHPAYRYRYRLRDELSPPAAAYRGRLREAADALGQPLDTERTGT